jgi:hypothetical protein
MQGERVRPVPGRAVAVTARRAARSRLVLVVVAAAMAVSCAGAAGAGAARGAQAVGSARPIGRLAIAGVLAGVAARSSADAWAVGGDGASPDRAVLAHWNGRVWTVSDTSALAASASFGAVAAYPGGYWAVGGSGPIGGSRLLIVRMRGGTWTRKLCPAPCRHAHLYSVAATSARNAWAVGYIPGGLALILHWNGTAWKRQPVPGHVRQLVAVAATSATNAWAVGDYGEVILHWDGKAWHRIRSPHFRAFSADLVSVAATARDNAWAVGTVGTSTLILHWNGTVWRRVRSPNPGHGPAASNNLTAVASSAPDNAWATGQTSQGSGIFILHWDGHAWTRSPTPALAPGVGWLGAVATLPSDRAWAVGENDGGLILHWNGHAWRHIAG